MGTKEQNQQIASHSRRFNLGNYEHAEYNVTAPVEGDLHEHLIGLKQAVEKAHAHGTAETADKEETKEAAPASKPAKLKAGQAKKEKARVEEEEETEDDAGEEEELEDADEETETDDEDADEESEDEEEVETPKPTKGSKKVAKAPVEEETSSKKKFVKKGSTYSRGSELHKKLFAAEMKRINPKFMKENADKAKSISMKLNGSDFLDAEGAITVGFTKELTKLMKK